MLNNLKDLIVKLNSDTANLANCEKAKRIKKILLTVGITLTAIGIIGVFTCFVLFVTGTTSFMKNGFTSRVMVPFILFLPFGFATAIGATLTNLGFQIVIGGAVSKFVDNSINTKCPNCGDSVQEGEFFCTKCGTKIIKTCPKCGNENGVSDTFCAKCGEKL